MTMKMIIFWFHTYILHIMIHCSVLYLIFCCLLSTFSCYCKELLQFSKDLSTAKSTYKPLPSPHLLINIYGHQPFDKPLPDKATPLIFS